MRTLFINPQFSFINMCPRIEGSCHLKKCIFVNLIYSCYYTKKNLSVKKKKFN